MTGIPPNRILYVGDSYECDVLGSNNAGMVSALLLRKDYNQLEVRSDADVFSAEEIAQQQRDKFPAAKVVLPSLRVSDLEAVLGRYFSSAGSGDNGSP